MKQFTLRLDRKQQRPVVLLKNALTALVDTGAFIPVWTDDEEILENVLDAELVKEKVPFIGFGGIAFGNLYQVTIEVGDLIFPNMHIVANNELDTSYNLILSATMFQNLIYEIDDITFKKYYQRIYKKTGNGYKPWLEEIDKRRKEERNQENKLYIFGHSLDVTDGDILKELIEHDGIKTIIFHKDKARLGQQIANNMPEDFEKEF